MRRILFPAAILIATLPAAAAPTPTPQTTLHAAATMTNAEASKHQPAVFEATVTYYRSYARLLMVQEGNDAIFVNPPANLKLAPGDRVLIRGTMRESFRPYVRSDDITVIGHGALPKPEHPNFEQMIRGEADSRLVTVRALVRSADLVSDDPRSPTPATYLHMLVQGGQVDATVDNTDESALKGLLDAEVEITGVDGGIFDNKLQQIGILLHVPSLAWVKILKHAGSDPWSLPVTHMDRIITGYRTVDLSQRLHVRGTITFYQPGMALVLQDGRRSLWIQTDSWGPLHVGDVADAIGFPAVEKGSLALIHSEVHGSLVRAPLTPSLFTPHQLILSGNNGRNHAFELVSVEGQVMNEVRQATQDEYVLESEGRSFSAILSHSSSLNPALLPPMKEVPLGTRIRVTGICIPADLNLFSGEVPFDILMRDVDDIVVVARPPWLNVHHLTLIVGILLAFVIALGMRGWYMERRTRRQIGSLAYVERRRSKIMEDINHSKPLAGILEQITELVSLRLNGAASWCHVADGATLGNRPAQLHSSSLRTVEHPIPARSGSTLGSIFAAFDARTKSGPTENAALSMAAELATLAIETSHLYSDLVHRSEFDLLTDVPNRFTLKKALEEMIQAARQSAAIFGIIYIDLNEFKQVNDVYGHRAGDLYLQELTQRMKSQLRPGDTLARLGGDEFAVLVSEVRQRADVEEITARLESCFHEPFIGENYVVQGSASFGMALYPDDASSADSLLHAADAAMYVAKSARLGKTRSSGDRAVAELAHKDRA